MRISRTVQWICETARAAYGWLAARTRKEVVLPGILAYSLAPSAAGSIAVRSPHACLARWAARGRGARGLALSALTRAVDPFTHALMGAHAAHLGTPAERRPRVLPCRVYFLSAAFFSAGALDADFAIDVVGTMMWAYGVPFHITHGPPLVQSVGYASS